MICIIAAGLLAALVASAPLAPELPVGASFVQYLTAPDGVWSVSSAEWGVTVPAHVPGDLLTDLQLGGVIADPWFELTWLNTTTPGHGGAPLWDVGVWSYLSTFDLVDWPAGAAFLCIDGIKMAADVFVNGAAVAVTTDQFLRVVAALPPGLLQPKGNVIRVDMSTSRDPRNHRMSGASGGWVSLPRIARASLAALCPPLASLPTTHSRVGCACPPRAVCRIGVH